MAHSNSSGRAASVSMADFNARAKRIAESTGVIEKGETRRPAPSRFRRDSNGGIPAAPKAATPATES